MSALALVQCGSIANHNGDILERQIESLLQKKGYRAGALDGMSYARQYRQFANIYGAPWRLDFFVVHPDKWPDGLAIESKWQSSGGSADEKLFFAVRSLEALPCPCVLIIGSDGARACAVNWCKQAAAVNPQLTVLHGLDNVLKWAQGAL